MSATNGSKGESNGHRDGFAGGGNGNCDAPASNGRGDGAARADTNGNEPWEISSEAEMERMHAALREMERAKQRYGTATVPSVKLHCGHEMPALALGTAMLCPGPQVVGIIKTGIDLGYRHIDTAPIYGTEMLAGEAIQAKLEDGTVTREELFVTTKLWSTYHRRDLVEEACQDSLRNLGLDYIDLYLIHNPISLKEGIELFPKRDGLALGSTTSDFMDAWRGMEDLVRQGLVRNIGVSNFNSQQVARVVNEGAIVPAVNQVECHQYFNQSALSEFCKMRGVLLVGFGTLGSAGTPPQYLTPGRPVLQDPLVGSVAEKHGKTPAQVLIRYQLQRGHGVVVRCSTAPRLWSNLQATTFTLTKEEMRALGELDAGERHYRMENMGVHNKNYPFSAPF